mgnify:CR=1 FL=1
MTESNLPQIVGPSPKQTRRHRRHILQWRVASAMRGMSGSAQAEGRDDPQLRDFAIAVIAVGARFRRWAGVLIESVRARGGYGGTIYVVTDTLDAFADYDGVIAIPVATTRHSLVAKTCKTYLYRWIPKRYILYVDADIIIGQPIVDWCRNALNGLSGHSALFYRDFGSRDMPYHGGLILMDSTRCAALFDRWRQQLNSGRFFKDQEALKRIVLPSEIDFFPQSGLCFPDHKMIAEQRTACFVHLTRERYTQLGDATIRHYLVDVLDVVSVNERLDFSK